MNPNTIIKGKARALGSLITEQPKSSLDLILGSPSEQEALDSSLLLFLIGRPRSKQVKNMADPNKRLKALQEEMTAAEGIFKRAGRKTASIDFKKAIKPAWRNIPSKNFLSRMVTDRLCNASPADDRGSEGIRDAYNYLADS